MAKHRAGRSSLPPSHPLASPSVIGLDAGREIARRHQRRQRRRDRVVAGFTAVLVLGFLGTAAWVGYSVYRDQQTDEELERERHSAVVEDAGDDVREAIDELESQPVWNGPVTPLLRIGGDEDQPGDEGGDPSTATQP